MDLHRERREHVYVRDHQLAPCCKQGYLGQVGRDILGVQFNLLREMALDVLSATGATGLPMQHQRRSVLISMEAIEPPLRARSLAAERVACRSPHKKSLRAWQ